MKDASKKQFNDHRSLVRTELAKSGVLQNVDQMLNATEYTAKALENVAKYLATIRVGDENPCEACGRKGISPESSGKLLSYLAKVTDELTRLFEFAKGKPDQRVEVANLTDLMRVLQALPNEKFITASQLIEEAMTLAEDGTSH